MTLQGRMKAHRIAWLACHPLAVWVSVPYLGFTSTLPTGLRIVAAALLILFPMALHARWESTEPYRARTYFYSVALALAGGLLWGFGALLFVLAIGGAWR